MRCASPLILLLSICSTGWTKPSVGLCAVNDPLELAAVDALSGWVRMGTVRADCDGVYRGRFVGDGVRVRFELATPGGAVLARGVPWITGAERPLSRLATADRLGAFAVLLDALLVEDRLGAAEPVRTAASPEAAPPTRPPRRRATQKPAPAPPPVVSTHPEPAPAPEPALALEPPPPPEPAPKIDPEAQPPVRLTWSAPTPPPKDPVAVSAFASGRWRWPSLLAAELGGDVRWRALYAEAAWQAPTTWHYEGATVTTHGASLGTGWRPALWQSGPWMLRGRLGALGEMMRPQRIDRPNLPVSTASSLGGVAGTALSLATPGVGATLRAEAAWSPLGPRVCMDAETERCVKLNVVSARLALAVAVGE